ncbi:hypothetical protein NPX13_g6263 [Xylaria arbuscula]|uniref:Uncharacterized protein n=1 Tax=Xylaria arbuscula TaxID=114810 RepID=A0A9W8NCV9_9PEZI|nr:hypothetical protein NPX13_g6263 [Xylaria arbuscula]
MAHSSVSGIGLGQPGLNPLGVQFFSSLEGLEVTSSVDRQLIRGHNLVGAVRLQFVRPSFFDDDGGEHGEVLDEIDGIDVPLSMHVYPFPQTDEWESQWFFFDVQLHPYELHFRRRIEDGVESAVGKWEDSYAKLAQVRGQMCVQPIAIRSLRLANGSFPSMASRASFHGPVDTRTFRFKAGSLSSDQLKCCGFIQCSTYLVPPRDRDLTFKGSQMFHILAYMPHDQQPWKSRIDWMKSSPEGGFASRKWMYGRGSIVGVLNPALLEEGLQDGQDILVVLADEFGFTSKATFDSAATKEPFSQKTKTESGKRRNPFSSSPHASPSKRTRDSSSRQSKDKMVEVADDQYIPIDPRLELEFAGHETGGIPVPESESEQREVSALLAEGEDKLLKLPVEGTTYPSFEEMRRHLFEFTESQGYGIRICRSFQKLSKVTGDPVARKRLVWECNRAGRTEETRITGDRPPTGSANAFSERAL